MRPGTCRKTTGLILVATVNGLGGIGASATTSPVAASSSLRLERAGARVYLVQGRARLLLKEGNDFILPFQVGWSRQSWSLRTASGATVTLPKAKESYASEYRQPQTEAILITKTGAIPQRIALAEITAAWLKDDANWHDHAEANTMRYQQGRGANFRLLLSDPIVVGDSILAILNWKDLAGSGQFIKARHLVRITTGAKPTLERLRILSAGDYATPPPTLFLSNGRLLLWDVVSGQESNLIEISPQGQEKSVTARFPASAFPQGVAAHRWLLLASSEGRDRNGLRAYDFQTRTSRTLFTAQGGAQYAAANPETPFALVDRLGASPNAYHTYRIDLRNGHKVTYPNPSGYTVHWLWHGLLITPDRDDTGYFVYDAASGRLRRRLAASSSLAPVSR